MDLDRLAKKAMASMARSSDGVSHLDKNSARALLEAAGYTLQKERDLELYVKKEVVVLDNELGRYDTTVQDVALRKSPTVKEMVSIRNAVKILKDSDVKRSVKADTVDWVHTQALALLDLSYTRADVEQIAKDGMDSLENKYEKGVKQALDLFAELLGYIQAPGALGLAHAWVYGKEKPGPSTERVLSPAVVFDRMHGRLVLVEARVSGRDKAAMTDLKKVLSQKKKADTEGAHVFGELMSRVPPYPGNMPVWDQA